MDKDVVLEEYKTLRTEILMHLDKSLHVFTWLITVYVALVGFVLRYGGKSLTCDIAGILSFLVLMPFVSIYQWERRKIEQAATYIQVCIESKIPELNWAKMNIESRGWGKASRIGLMLDLFLGDLRGPEIIFYLFGLLSWLLPFVIFKERGYHTGSMLLLIILTAIYLAKLLFFSLSRYSRRDKKVRQWQEQGLLPR